MDDDGNVSKHSSHETNQDSEDSEWSFDPSFPSLLLAMPREIRNMIYHNVYPKEAKPKAKEGPSNRAPQTQASSGVVKKS